MRIRVTIPDDRATTLDELTQALGLTRSQLIDEALMFFARMVGEVQRGRVVCSFSDGSSQPVTELLSPSLLALGRQGAAWGQEPLSPAQQEALGRILGEPTVVMPALAQALLTLPDPVARKTA